MVHKIRWLNWPELYDARRDGRRCEKCSSGAAIEMKRSHYYLGVVEVIPKVLRFAAALRGFMPDPQSNSLFS